MSATPALLMPLESLLNRNIAASASARALCRRLASKTLALHVDGLPIRLYFRSNGETMMLDTKLEGVASATLSGTPLSFARLAGPKPEAALRTGTVHIEGDAEVAQTFSELLREARPDLEEELSHVVGDVAAHQIGNAGRGVLAFGRRVADTFMQNVAEYLTEEAREVPTRTEADEFVSAVDKLRDDVERLEARLVLVARGKAIR
jgi:ubiquinone biosynthesis protein UbiJ